jgi:2-polyprenyl-6-methoxyphenol hydroxylase-like FAD-dependent oxidoreductase
VLIGADGIHSTMRRHYYPEDEVRFGGQLMGAPRSNGAPF